MDNAPLRRRHPLLKLRGLDPVMLEVQGQEMLRRPTAQLEPLNLLDLIALFENPSHPKAIANALGLWVGRAEREMADIPSGRPWMEFLDEYASVPGRHVPETFRGWLRRQAERGEGRAADRIHQLLARWAGEEPEPFLLGKLVTRVVTVAAPPPEPTSRERASVRAPRDRAPEVTRAAAPVADPAQHQWLVDVVLERVAQAPESGLAEAVLLAGIKHRARDRFPHLSPADIQAVLRELKANNRVRYSAGRYSPTRRY